MLFGSLQRADAVPGSDADVLLVLRATDLPFAERAAVYRPEGVGIPVGLFSLYATYTRRAPNFWMTCWPPATALSAGHWRRSGTCFEPYPRPTNGIFVAITVMN